MPDLKIRILSDSADARADVEGFGAVMEKAMLPAAAAGAALVAWGADAVSAASEAQQAAGALEATFGDATAAMTANAEAAAGTVGLSEAAYAQMASTIGSQLGNMGVAQDEIAGTTDELIAKGADLAAQFGGSTADAVSALSSLMRGERDPIERYGVSISAAAIEAQKARTGLSGLTGEADRAATTQATLALLSQQTASSTGAFARETGTAAGAQAIATASWENAQATLGTALLPAVTAAASAMAALATWVQQNSDVVLILVGVVGALAAGVLLVNGAMAAGRAAIAAATAAQWLWNAAMSANPLGLIVLAVAAVVAAIVVLVRNWDTVKRVALDVWNAISGAVTNAAGWLTSTWSNAIGAVQGFFVDLHNHAVGIVNGIVDWFASIPNRVAGFFNSIQIPGWISDALSFLDLTAPAAELVTSSYMTFASTSSPTTSSVARTIRASTATTAAPLVININGAVDPVATGRQVRKILTNEARYSGRVALNGAP